MSQEIDPRDCQHGYADAQDEALNRRAPDPRDEVIEKCRVALESMGVLATAIFDGEFNEAPTLLLYVVGKTLLGVNEALAAIKALEGK